MSFIHDIFVFHAGTLYGLWTSSSHGISMEFAKKMMRFLSDMVSFLTKLPSTGHEKIPVTFYEWFSVFLTEPQKLNGEVFAGTEALQTVKHFV